MKDIFWSFISYFCFTLLAFYVIYPSLKLLPFVDSRHFVIAGTLVARDLCGSI